MGSCLFRTAAWSDLFYIMFVVCSSAVLYHYPLILPSFSILLLAPNYYQWGYQVEGKEAGTFQSFLDSFLSKDSFILIYLPFKNVKHGWRWCCFSGHLKVYSMMILASSTGWPTAVKRVRMISPKCLCCYCFFAVQFELVLQKQSLLPSYCYVKFI